WEQIKAAEARDKGSVPILAAALDRLPKGLPALLQAQRLGEKVARTQADWHSLTEVLDRVREEHARLEGEVRAAMEALSPEGMGPSDVAGRIPQELRARLEAELGDTLFSLCQLARWLGLSAEDSLRGCSRRFIERCL